ncbi:MAG: DUF932 domain-containing protein [Desulfobulbaceae bacterium]|nr:DUF932 domain-containing protein [Desulfobulbaceae bacterium]
MFGQNEETLAALNKLSESLGGDIITHTHGGGEFSTGTDGETLADYHMFSVGRRPLHGIHVPAEMKLSAEEAMAVAGLDWEVERKPLYFYMDEDTLRQAKQGFAIVRKNDQKTLGVVGPRYTPIQNSEAFGAFQEWTGDRGLEFVAGGAMSGGKKVWLQAKMPDTFEAVKGDAVQKYLFLMNSFDGSSSLTIRITPTRVVCCNMVASIISRKGKRVKRFISVKHTKNFRKTLEASLENIFGISNQSWQQFEAMAKAMVHVQLNVTQFNEYAHALFPDPQPKEGEVEVSETRLVNAQGKRDQLTELFENGLGQDIPGVQGTAWAAYNALTEYNNYYIGGETSQDRRFQSAILAGQGISLQNKAEDFLMAYAA